MFLFTDNTIYRMSKRGRVSDSSESEDDSRSSEEEQNSDEGDPPPLDKEKDDSDDSSEDEAVRAFMSRWKYIFDLFSYAI